VCFGRSGVHCEEHQYALSPIFTIAFGWNKVPQIVKGNARFTAFGLLCVLATACGSGAQPSNGANVSNGYSKPDEGVFADHINFGLMMPLTGPGVPNFGEAWIHGFGAAFDQANSQGGIFGRKIQLDIQNDAGDVATGVAAYKVLQTDHVIGLFGPSTSSIQLAILPKVTDDKTPMIEASVVVKQGFIPYNDFYYGVQCSFADQADVGFAYEQQLMQRAGVSAPKVAVVHPAIASGAEWSGLWQERANKAGWTYLGDQTYPNDAVDLTAIVRKLVAQKPDVVAFIGLGDAYTVLFAKTLAQYNLSPHVLTVAGNMSEPAWLAMPSSQQPNFQPVNCWQPLYADSAVPGIKKLQGIFAKNNWSLTDGGQAQHAYVAAQIVVAALRAAGNKPTRASFQASLNGITGYSTDGISPNISFGPRKRDGLPGAAPFAYDATKKEFLIQGSFGDWTKYITHEYDAA
jgi:branched-chain amino acid transport system substrate-binding protein